MHRLYKKWGVGFLPEVKQADELGDSRRTTFYLQILLAGLGLLLTIVVLLLFRLRRVARQAGHANAAKSTFLATMSHETRTPLNGIIGLAEALEEEPLAPHQKQMATSIAQCGRNLIALVNDVLDYSKLDAGKLELAQTPFSLREMVQPVADSLGNIARQKGLAFHTRIAPEVPDTVCGDPLRLAQVLFNLLGNAVKFTERGEVALDISLHAGTTVFQVHDTGIGMTPAETANLFQAFWQAEQSTTRRFGGTGLGLSISRRLVEMMGGSFQVRSEKGVGSTFSFDLSLPLSSIPPPDPVPHRVSPGTSLRLLFADDNAVNQRVIERLLLKLGHQVTVVNNGAEAVAAFERDSFDAVLLDCHMPVEDGFSAARRMRIHERTQSRDSRTPILALTALAFAEDRDRCLQAGMDAHLTKPISLQQLDDALRAALPTHALPTHAPPAKNANSALTSQSTCTPSPPTAASS
jgi:signal transduction histidine kinase/DNA-binding NarL/FixJ family response regulator